MKKKIIIIKPVHKKNHNGRTFNGYYLSRIPANIFEMFIAKLGDEKEVFIPESDLYIAAVGKPKHDRYKRRSISVFIAAYVKPVASFLGFSIQTVWSKGVIVRNEYNKWKFDPEKSKRPDPEINEKPE